MPTDFAAAQARVLARREASAAAQRAAETRHRQQCTTQVDILRLPPSLRTYATESLVKLSSLTSPYGSRPAFRVGQVDAELLDEELLTLLTEQMGEGLRLFGAHLKDDWDAEIGLALRTVLWKLSIWDQSASYGASLQGLTYVDGRRGAGQTSSAAGGDLTATTKGQRALYGLVTVGGRYAWKKWEDYLTNLDMGYTEPRPMMAAFSRLTTLVDSTHSLAAFASFLLFLYNGRYRTLLDRFLGMRLVPNSNQTNREVSFEYLNRQLVWHAFTEFLLFLLPLVGITRWKRWLARAWKRVKLSVKSLSKTQEEMEAEELVLEKNGELAFLPERTCAICYRDQNPTGGQSEQEMLASSAASGGGVIGSASTDITNPYTADPCQCIYCFVCLAQRIESEEGEGWSCLRCGEVVKSCRPWDGDVVAPKHHRSGSAWSKANGVSGAGSIDLGRKLKKKRSVTFADAAPEDEDVDEDGFKDEAYEDGEETDGMENLDPRPVEHEVWR